MSPVDIRTALDAWNPDCPRTKQCPTCGHWVKQGWVAEAARNCTTCHGTGRVPDGTDTLLTVVERLVRDAYRNAAEEIVKCAKEDFRSFDKGGNMFEHTVCFVLECALKRILALGL